MKAYAGLVKHMRHANEALLQHSLTLKEFLDAYALYVYELDDNFYDFECLSWLEAGHLFCWEMRYLTSPFPKMKAFNLCIV